MLKFRLISAQLLLTIGALVLSACGATAATEVPTLTPVNPDVIRTEAVATFASDLTATAFAAPTDTPSPSPTPQVTLGPAVTSTAGIGFGSTQPVAGGGTTGGATSCYGLSFVRDVSIPDNTPVTPGQAFTKTWEVRNSGSCAWDAGFKFSFTGGEQMGGTAYTLPSSVAAGALTQISVPMTAPNKTGTLRGNWRMSTASGQFFGDEVYVQVVIGGAGAAPTNTGAAPAATSTTAPAATETETTPEE
ncbi:MAG TPA: NBR1-Ig-like domain-containing protein [Anaerolineales bacterium]|nr:NBR1-Ig-like domain-containing protein [Anaerolineales bacterium]